MKLIWLSVGWLSLVVGIIGIVVPILPTTPFVLLAAFCFSKGSEYWHAWLLAHPQLGPLIRDWNQHGVIRPRIKLFAALSLTTGFSFLFAFAPIPVIAKVFLGTCGAAVLLFIFTRPSGPTED